MKRLAGYGAAVLIAVAFLGIALSSTEDNEI
jgi:hypothetical protein